MTTKGKVRRRTEGESFKTFLQLASSPPISPQSQVLNSSNSKTAKHTIFDNLNHNFKHPHPHPHPPLTFHFHFHSLPLPLPLPTSKPPSPSQSPSPAPPNMCTQTITQSLCSHCKELLLEVTTEERCAKVIQAQAYTFSCGTKKTTKAREYPRKCASCVKKERSEKPGMERSGKLCAVKGREGEGSMMATSSTATATPLFRLLADLYPF